MQKIIFSLSVFLFLIAPLHAADEVPAQSPSSYLSLPADATVKAPALILIHEWWGVNEQMRKTADEFAGAGYASYVVDLYEGKATDKPSEAHELMRGLPDDRAMQTLRSAVTFLRSHSAIDPDRIGVLGWCMGGGYALQFALEEPTIQTVVMYYGKLVTDEKRLTQLKMPLLGIFGAKDQGISKESVENFKRTLDKLSKPNEIYIYDNAGHAFTNPNNPNYRADDAKDARQKTLVFLKQHLA